MAYAWDYEAVDGRKSWNEKIIDVCSEMTENQFPLNVKLYGNDNSLTWHTHRKSLTELIDSTVQHCGIRLTILFWRVCCSAELKCIVENLFFALFAHQPTKSWKCMQCMQTSAYKIRTLFMHTFTFTPTFASLPLQLYCCIYFHYFHHVRCSPDCSFAFFALGLVSSSFSSFDFVFILVANSMLYSSSRGAAFLIHFKTSNFRWVVIKMVCIRGSFCVRVAKAHEKSGWQNHTFCG